jgi:hypothetical protein
MGLVDGVITNPSRVCERGQRDSGGDRANARSPTVLAEGPEKEARGRGIGWAGRRMQDGLPMGAGAGLASIVMLIVSSPT